MIKSSETITFEIINKMNHSNDEQFKEHEMQNEINLLQNKLTDLIYKRKSLINVLSKVERDIKYEAKIKVIIKIIFCILSIDCFIVSKFQLLKNLIFLKYIFKIV